MRKKKSTCLVPLNKGTVTMAQYIAGHEIFILSSTSRNHSFIETAVFSISYNNHFLIIILTDAFVIF